MKKEFRILMLASLFTTACASTPEDYENEVDALHKQIRELKRERDAAREDYDADISRAFRRDQLDRRFPYSGMPDAPDWQKKRSEQADEEEYQALVKKKAAYEASQISHVQTPHGYFPVKNETERPSDATCIARPVYTMYGKIVGYRRTCSGFDH